MDSTYREIIREILKEEQMEEKSLVRLLEWYETWTKKLAESIAAEDYSKIIDNHFKTGLGLLATMKKTIKSNPELRGKLFEQMNTLRAKIIVLNDARKLIDTLK